MNEVWKPVKGFENLYEISTFGRVRSLDRKVFNGKGYYVMKGKMLSPAFNELGYEIIRLVNGEQKKMARVHRLVGYAFIPNPENKPFINHKDGNPANNHVSNLEWCTQRENVIHALETGLRENSFFRNKEKILREYINNPNTNVKELARKYKCGDSSIRKYLKRQGVQIRDTGATRDVYKIDRKQMVEMFEKGYSNKEITNKLGGNSGLIAAYRYKYKKGKLII